MKPVNSILSKLSKLRNFSDYLLEKQSHPWRRIFVIAIVLITVLGILFWKECRDDDIREQKYQQYIKECEREDDLLEWDYDCCMV